MHKLFIFVVFAWATAWMQTSATLFMQQNRPIQVVIKGNGWPKNLRQASINTGLWPQVHNKIIDPPMGAIS